MISSKMVNFKDLTIKLASPETIKNWSHGEITKPETINYRTLKPEKDGLFCERIFGPSKDWECYCGKYKRIRYKGIICDKCGVEVTLSRVRRERMGHISLACPIAHIWFFKGIPSKLSLLLGITPRNLAGVIYFARYLVLSTNEDKRKEALSNLKKMLGETLSELEEKNRKEIQQTKQEGKKEIIQLKKKIKTVERRDLTIQEINLKIKQEIMTLKDNLFAEKERAEQIFKTISEMVKKIKQRSVLSEDEYLKLMDYDAIDFLEVGMGAESLLKMIKSINFDKLADELRKTAQTGKGQNKIKATKRLRLIEGIKKANILPSWMITNILPVLPPDLRPMVQLAGGRFASADLNDLYRRVINRNNRLKHLINLGAPEIILKNEKRMLQEAVDNLIDSTISGRTTRRGIKELRSLSEMLKGKQGRFRQNLLGKRVDYSGRSVIVVGPNLALNECGLPKEMALEIFKPYVLKEVIKQGLAPNVKSAKYYLEARNPEVFDILEKITKKHPILLNRAPTLHKLGIQAFYPILIEGDAIQLHPCVCSGYNADFDGDQMAVHLLLSKPAIKEAEEKMMPQYNLLKPSDGSPVTLPNKEMVFGIYCLTLIKNDPKNKKTFIFSDTQSAVLTYQHERVNLHQEIKLKVKEKYITTSVGRIFFNEALFGFTGFINEAVDNSRLKKIISKALKTCKPDQMIKLIDNLKSLGFWGATESGLSLSLQDCKIIPEKPEIISQANKKVADIEQNYKLGLITEDEKKRLSNEIWMETTEDIANKTWNNFGQNNSVKVIIDSGGTRASKDQVKQLAAMRGLVVDPLGKIVELPTKSNFREGLSVFEYVTSSRGSRKGLTDSAIKTADAGYLTRRLVDVSHDVIIRINDCKTKKYLSVKKEGIRKNYFLSRILGRVLAKNIVNPKTKKILIKAGEIVSDENIDKVKKANVKEVFVRSPLTCDSKYGLCQKCYGWDFSKKNIVEIGTPVGVLAAQSVGEPGTQLTMRVKHFGGIVVSDVTQGLPRVEELFEARTPKMISPITEFAGKVKVDETPSGYKIKIKSVNIKPVEEKEYLIPLTSILKVKSGDLVPIGTQLASGGLDLKEVLRIRGFKEVQEYLINEVQFVYESQGIPIRDKHFEVIVRKMSDKVRIESSGDTNLLSGELVEKIRFEEENEAILASGGEPSTAQVVILGITRASLYTESWLSAASFQETSNVLTNASLEGKKDKLLGLKENVIIGRLIPTNAQRAKIGK